MTKPGGFLSGLFGKKREETAIVEEAAAAPNDPSSTEEALADAALPTPTGFLQRLKEGLARSTRKLVDGVTAIVAKKKLDRETLDALEELLIESDLGVVAASRVCEALAKDRFDKEISDAEVKSALAEVVAETLEPYERPLTIDPGRRPHVILTVGVNGGGKTTTIGKLAARFRREGKRVVLAAGDTFRAAAVEQLKTWGARADAVVIAKDQGSDSAGLAFEALTAARHDDADVLIIDTAGRLQNRRELMDELAKIVRVLKKIDPTAPHDVLLVLDATVGQNALSQAEAFRDAAGVTGLVMTKLDGTARGGVLVALTERFKLPIHFIGVGEQIDDLQAFKARRFADALAGLS